MSKLHASVKIFRFFRELLPSHWLRRRGTLGPPQVMLSLMVMGVMGYKGYEKTIDVMKEDLGKELGWPDDAPPSTSALCQARRKLDAVCCAELVEHVYALCSAARAQPSSAYANKRLVALDGTKLALPPYRALREFYGCPTQGPGREQLCPQASLTVMWDVGANQPITWRVGTYRTSERVHGMDMLGPLRAGDLLLADRNFPSRRMLLAVHERRADFLMRMRTTGVGVFTAVRDFCAGTASEMPYDFAPGMPVRLLRAVLPDGSVAVFMTSLLDKKLHPLATLVKLYRKRWGIETAFRELKLWHGLEQFHARHVEGIAQEITAMMIFQLLSSELEAKARIAHQVTVGPDDVHTTGAHEIRSPHIRFSRVILTDCIVKIIFAASISDQMVTKAFDHALFRLWRYRQKVRPARHFKRERKSPLRGFKTRGTKGKGRP